MNVSRRLLTRSAAAVLTLGLAGAGLALAVPAASAADAPFSFEAAAPVGPWVSRIVSPGAGVVQAVGLDGGQLRIDTQKDGGPWTTQRIPLSIVTPTAADAGAAEGVTYVIASSSPFGASYNTVPAPSGVLYRIDASGITQLPLPTWPVQGWFIPLRVSTDGTRVAVTGTHKTAAHDYLGETVTSVLANGVWTNGTPINETYRAFRDTGGDGEPAPLMVQGHPVDLTQDYGQHSFTRAWDFTPGAEKLIGNLYTATSTTTGASVFDFPFAITSTDPSTVTGWGYRNTGGTLTGLCKVVTNGASSDCAAPDMSIGAATLLGDGRTLLGGTAFAGGTDQGFMIAETDGTFTHVPATLGGAPQQLVTSPSKSDAWALERAADGSLLVQHAALLAAPTPTATSTTPTPTGTVTPTPTGTATPPAPTGTPTPAGTTKAPKPSKSPKPTKTPKPTKSV